MIELRHLQKAYPTSMPLKDVCTTIHKGDVIAVIGASGCGKSTLLTTTVIYFVLIWLILFVIKRHKKKKTPESDCFREFVWNVKPFLSNR